MHRRTLLRALAAGAAFLAARPPVGFASERRLRAVATFSILGDMLYRVGGDRIEMTTLVGPDGDAHVYQPTPADARSVAAAEVILVNGLGFEGWIDRLIAASGFKGTVIVASTGVTPLTADEEDGDDEKGHGHDAVDPHAWQSLDNGAIYVGNIERGLIAADPSGTDVYKANAERYRAEMAALNEEVRAAIGKLPSDRRTVVTSHEAFAYFGQAYGLRFLAPEGVSTDAEASAKDVARLIRQIRQQRIPAVFMENISDPRLIERIREETGAVIGGALYSDALSEPGGPAASYLEMFRYNTRTLVAALGG